MVRVLARSPKTSMDQWVHGRHSGMCQAAVTPDSKNPETLFWYGHSGVVLINTLAGPWMHLSCPSRVAPGWLGWDSHLGAAPSGSFSPRGSHPNSWLGASTSGSGQTPLITPAPPASASFVSQPSSAGKCQNLDTYPFRNHKANKDVLLPPALSPSLSLRAPLSMQMFHAISPKTGKETDWWLIPLIQIYSCDRPGRGAGAAAWTPGGGWVPALLLPVI